MADTAAERLAKAMYPWGGDALMIKPAQRAIVGSSLGVVPQPYACVAHDALGTPPPPDPWEAIARELHDRSAHNTLHRTGCTSSCGVRADLLAAVRDLIPDEAEARTIAARIEEGT